MQDVIQAFAQKHFPSAPPRRGLLGLAWGLLLMAAAPAAGCAQAASSAPRSAAEPPGPPPPGDGERARWLVTFTEAPVATRFAGTADTGTEGSREDRKRVYAEALRSAREPRLAAIRSLGAVVLSTMEYSANAAVVEGPAGRAAALVDALRKIDGVGSVQPSGIYRADPVAPPAPLKEQEIRR